MMNANRGYVGWSMSVRAADAYENGEMPKSKWTKQAMLAAIEHTLGERRIILSDAQMANLNRLPRDVIFDNLLAASSWHHTSKQFNRTDFYSVDVDALVSLAQAGADFIPDWTLLVRGVREPLHFATRRERDAWYAEHGCQSGSVLDEGYAKKFAFIR